MELWFFISAHSLMMLYIGTNGWMDDLRFYVLFNSISVISGRCLGDNERLCAMELRLRLRRFHLEWGSNSVRLISRPALNPLSYRGSLLVQSNFIYIFKKIISN